MTNLDQSFATNPAAEEFTQEKNTAKRRYIWIIAISIVVALVWIISPVDPVPDVVVGLGQIDDILVAATATFNSLLAFRQLIMTVRSN